MYCNVDNLNDISDLVFKEYLRTEMDLEKCLNIMKFLDWDYSDPDDMKKQPVTMERITQCIMDLFHETLDAGRYSPEYAICSGGFQVTVKRIPLTWEIKSIRVDFIPVIPLELNS